MAFNWPTSQVSCSGKSKSRHHQIIRFCGQDCLCDQISTKIVYSVPGEKRTWNLCVLLLICFLSAFLHALIRADHGGNWRRSSTGPSALPRGENWAGFSLLDIKVWTAQILSHSVKPHSVCWLVDCIRKRLKHTMTTLPCCVECIKNVFSLPWKMFCCPVRFQLKDTPWFSQSHPVFHMQVHAHLIVLTISTFISS